MKKGKAICPYCGNSELHFMVSVNLSLYQNENGLFVDKNMTNEMNEDNPVEINTVQSLPRPFLHSPEQNSGINVVVTEGKEEEITVICFSEKCQGREMTYSELLLPEDMKIASKPF